MINSIIFILFSVLVLVNVVDAKAKVKATHPAAVITDDLPYIKCEVCERVVVELVTNVKKMRESLPKTKKLEEYRISEIFDNVCNPSNATYGMWIRKIDITKRGKYLHLDEPGGVSKCNGECLTVAKSCHDMLENEIDQDEISAMLYKSNDELEIDHLIEPICWEMAGRCKTFRDIHRTPFERDDERFQAMTEKELEMEKLLANMKNMGMSGSLYNREDMEDAFDGEEYADSDEEL